MKSTTDFLSLIQYNNATYECILTDDNFPSKLINFNIFHDILINYINKKNMNIDGLEYTILFCVKENKLNIDIKLIYNKKPLKSINEEFNIDYYEKNIEYINKNLESKFIDLEKNLSENLKCFETKLATITKNPKILKPNGTNIVVSFVRTNRTCSIDRFKIIEASRKKVNEENSQILLSYKEEQSKSIDDFVDINENFKPYILSDNYKNYCTKNNGDLSKYIDNDLSGKPYTGQHKNPLLYFTSTPKNLINDTLKYYTDKYSINFIDIRGSDRNCRQIHEKDPTQYYLIFQIIMNISETKDFKKRNIYVSEFPEPNTKYDTIILGNTKKVYLMEILDN